MFWVLNRFKLGVLLVWIHVGPSFTKSYALISNFRVTSLGTEWIEVGWDLTPPKSQFSIQALIIQIGTSVADQPKNLNDTNAKWLRLIPGTQYEVKISLITSGTEYSAAIMKVTTVPVAPLNIIISRFINPVSNQFRVTGSKTIMYPVYGVVVSWQQPNIGGYDDYKLTISPRHGSVRTPITVKGGIPTQDDTAQKRIVWDLIPGTFYEFIVQSKSNGVLSAPIKGYQRMPPEPPTRIEVSQSTPFSAVLSWDDDYRGVLDGYAIETIPFGAVSTLLHSSPTIPRRLLQKLIPGSRYTAHVYSTMDGIWSFKPGIKDFYTPPEAPSEKIVEEVTSESVFTTWNSPSGNLDYYEVLYYPTNRDFGRLRQRVWEPRLNLTTLEPGSSYMVVIQAISNGLYSEPFKEVVYTRPLPPYNVETITTQDTIVISWFSDDTYSQTKIEFFSETEETITTTILEPGVTEASISNFTFNCRYEIKVTTIKNGIESESVSETITTNSTKCSDEKQEREILSITKKRIEATTTPKTTTEERIEALEEETAFRERETFSTESVTLTAIVPNKQTAGKVKNQSIPMESETTESYAAARTSGSTATKAFGTKQTQKQFPGTEESYYRQFTTNSVIGATGTSATKEEATSRATAKEPTTQRELSKETASTSEFTTKVSETKQSTAGFHQPSEAQELHTTDYQSQPTISKDMETTTSMRLTSSRSSASKRNKSEASTTSSFRVTTTFQNSQTGAATYSKNSTWNAWHNASEKTAQKSPSTFVGSATASFPEVSSPKTTVISFPASITKTNTFTGPVSASESPTPLILETYPHLFPTERDTAASTRDFDKFTSKEVVSSTNPSVQPTSYSLWTQSSAIKILNKPSSVEDTTSTTSQRTNSSTSTRGSANETHTRSYIRKKQTSSQTTAKSSFYTSLPLTSSEIEVTAMSFVNSIAPGYSIFTNVTARNEDASTLQDMTRMPNQTIVTIPITEGFTTLCEPHNITVLVQKSAIEEYERKFGPLHFNGGCVGHEGENHYRYTIAPNIMDCGTQFIVNDTHVNITNSISNRVSYNFSYSSEIHNGTDVFNGNPGKESHPLIYLDIFCTFPLDLTVQTGLTPDLRMDVITFNVSGVGQFSATMQLFKDAEYLKPYYSAPSLSVNGQLRVGITLLKTLDESITIAAKRCWATPVRNQDFEITYQLIDDFCVIDGVLNGKLEMIENGESKRSRWEGPVFKFVRFNEVWLHCELKVCFGNSCDTDCDKTPNTSRRRKRENSFGPTLTVGPISNTASSDQPLSEIMLKSDDSNSRTLVIVISASIMVIAFLLSVVLVTIFLRCRKKTEDMQSITEFDSAQSSSETPANIFERPSRAEIAGSLPAKGIA